MSNPSSGKMGIALAEVLLLRGAKVILVTGPISENVPEQAEVRSVTTTQEMLDTVLEEISLHKADVFISAAAVLDYEPAEKEERKIGSGSEDLSIKLVPTKKIIEEARKKYKDLIIVGFKVESGIPEKELEKRARAKIDAGICNLVVANDAQKKGAAFAGDTNEVLIVGPGKDVEHIPLAPKREIASHIVDAIVKILK